ncbi:MAG: putative transcription regulator [Candidatus Berkelbacteria bacterium Licking1014_2]|uniref:Putative transcription regulator n=1 Tax=Candidatus Berkelbacteria bacterium Licking1014_2 TaxID=2017146 RepID=A0A554LVX0_9BACT|nr:MAG: putative transcription regulator [Candidatus Berkelbacteria bacterium Licking1014_2]
MVEENNKENHHQVETTEAFEPKRKPKKWWRIIKWIFGLLLLAIISFLISASLFGWQTVSKIIENKSKQASPFLTFLGQVQPNQLKGEGDGRINIVLLGVGGKTHPGGALTDTNILLSVDPENHQAGLLSIPRDLYVPIVEKKYYNKLNTVYNWGEENKKTAGGGSQAVKDVVGRILDLPIHYYIKADFTALEKIVDALGGIDVTVEKDLYDPLFPAVNMIDYEPFSIKAGRQRLNGKIALKYARSRETTSDFDRSKRQQQVLTAIKDKALTLGVLSNPVKIKDIISILGDHLRTDLQFQDMERLVKIIKDIDSQNIANFTLDTSTDGLLTSTADENGYYLMPTAGMGKFEDIQRLAHRLLSDPYLVKEKATIEIRNATGQTGIGGKVADVLRDYGYTVIKISQDESEQAKSAIYDYSNGQKKYTLNFLSQRFKSSIVQKPTDSQVAADIVLIVGKDYLSF